MTSPHSTSKSNDEPEAYAIGWVPFLGAKIFLDSHPLIPRTETEWWVEKFIAALAREENASAEHPQASQLGSPEAMASRGRYETSRWASRVIPQGHPPTSAPTRVLDLFAGSGCIGIAILKHIPDATVDFGEFDVRHMTTIEKNIRENSIDPNRTRVIQTDVFGAVDGVYDYILANPPYLSRSRIERIEHSVLEHEPVGALFAEDDGFALIAATLEGLPAHLRAGGQSWVEHEPEHASRIQALAQKLGFSASTHNDQYGVLRYSVILKP